MGVKSKIAALEQEVRQLKDQSLERLLQIDQKLDILLQVKQNESQAEYMPSHFPAAEIENSIDLNDCVIELFEDNDNEILDDLIDFFRPADPSKKQVDPSGNGLSSASSQIKIEKNEAHLNISAQSQSVEQKGTAPLNGLLVANKSKATGLDNRDFKLFCQLFNWVEFSLSQFGKQKIARILTLYADNGYLPENVYHPLIDVVNLASNQLLVEDKTPQTIHALMQLNQLFDGTVRLNMKELIEVVEGEN